MDRSLVGVVLGAALALLATSTPAAGHSYHSAGCPSIPAMPDFQPDKFLGEWYVMQKTKSSARCLINNYTRDASTPNQLHLEQSSAHAVLGLASKDGRYRYNGVLSPRENATSLADMNVRFKLNVAGSAAYTVVYTDYRDYASIVSCQDLPVGSRLSASVLSRTRKIAPESLEKARSVLAATGVDVTALEGLDQTEEGCKPPNGEGFHGAVQRAGDVINQGVQAVKEGAIKLFNKVRGQDDNSSKVESAESMEATNSTSGPNRQNLGTNSNKDAEWLP